MVSFEGLAYTFGVRYEDARMNKPMTPISHLKPKLTLVTTDIRIKHLEVTNSDNFVTKFDWARK
jgi:hypothetical protein